MDQVDLNITRARRMMVKGMLTLRMQDWIMNEEFVHNKIRERDRSNALLADNIDTLVREERKSALNLKQVVKGYDGSNRKRSSSAANNYNDFRPEKRAKLGRWTRRPDNSGPKKDGSIIRTKAKVKYQDTGLKDESDCGPCTQGSTNFFLSGILFFNL